MKSVFNKDKNLDATKQSMFFGPDLAVQRYDTMKYPIFDKLTQQQLGYFWRPEEVSLQKDRNDYLELREEQKFIFTSNLKYQTMLDSVQGRGPCLAFLPFVSLPELESAIITWDFMETIHSRSYTYIIKNLYSQPNEVFDTIIQDEKIEKRAASVTQTYDDLIAMGYKWTIDKKVDLYELKKRLYLAMVSVNILEGLRFYVSFACSFAFGELKKLEGSAKIISFIARDESQHLAMSQRILNNWKDYENDKDFLKIIKETEPVVYKMYDDAVQQEKNWATYLFSKGSMIGLSEKLLHKFVEYTANRRMRAIQLKPAYETKTNPLPWTDHWLNSKGTQNAPQETEIESYVIGGIKQDVTKDQFKKFKL
jgi:ribonucleotide reductase beta subunit family protein with ferritin-like domain|tara:strand:- start:10627 stop:11724 length:1098 start_codon:yes stop_codon:yes gene_type:complete